MNLKQATKLVDMKSWNESVSASLIYRAQGYIEAIEKAKPLAKALERASQMTMGLSLELQDSIMCEVVEALAKWEEIK